MQNTGNPEVIPITKKPFSGIVAKKGRDHTISWRSASWLVVVGLIAMILLQAGWRMPPDPVEMSLDRLTADHRFDLATWEVDAVTDKLVDFVRNPAHGLTTEQAVAAVREYLRLSNRTGELAGEIERAYSDPTIREPEVATRSQRSELAAMRNQLAADARTVEAILERQLSERIDAAGLTTAGLVWPPPRFRFTEPPQMLVLSPRDRIERLRTVDLKSDLDSADRDLIEQGMAQEQNLSSYVTGIGGYGVYPTMVIDRYGLPWTAETIAHEWVHNYLAFHPLGWSFLEGGESVTINETVASIVGEELGQAILEAYYPDLVPPARPAAEAMPQEPAEQADPSKPPAFEFGPEMRATRLVVDELLKKGKVDEAEAFMEARRLTFIENGYSLRVLNQAYFAFHGSYATGASSTDPIGPKLRQLRAQSPTLRDFLTTVDSITDVAGLDAALERTKG